MTLEGRPEGHIDQQEKLFRKSELQVQRLKATTMLSSFTMREGAQSELRSESQVGNQIIEGLTCWASNLDNIAQEEWEQSPSIPTAENLSAYLHERFS